MSTLRRRRLRVGPAHRILPLSLPLLRLGLPRRPRRCAGVARGKGGEVPGCTTLPDRMSCAMHEGLCARACMRVRGWGVASESTGMAVRGGEGVLEVEGVPGAAACSLLMLGVLFSSPSSRAADAACASCSAVWWVRTSTTRLGLQSSRARVPRIRSRSVQLGLSAACSPHRGMVRRGSSSSSSSAPRAGRV
jgi:hypothetical protein